MEEQCFWRRMFSFFHPKTNVCTGNGLYGEGKKTESRVVAEAAGGFYIIRDVSALLWVAEQVNSGYSFEGKTVQLACDMDIRDIAWKPIGVSAAKAFRGVFDGCGYVISGLRLQSDRAYVGFFGYVMGTDKVKQAVVRNVYLYNVEIQGEGEQTCVGGLVAKAQEGVLIEKCIVSGEIESRGYVGGIVGYVEDCVMIRRCVVKGSMSGSVVGGLVCYLYENSVIDNCQSGIRIVASFHVDDLVYKVQENSIIKECVATVL